MINYKAVAEMMSEEKSFGYNCNWARNLICNYSEAGFEISRIENCS